MAGPSPRRRGFGLAGGPSPAMTRANNHRHSGRREAAIRNPFLQEFKRLHGFRVQPQGLPRNDERDDGGEIPGAMLAHRPGMTSKQPYFFTSGQSLCASGFAASSGAIVAISL
jgi:hypothetical protein